jgi:integrase
MHTQSKRRSRGTGSLFQRNGRWVGQFRADGKLVKRTLGPVRAPGGRSGLTRTQAEAALREVMVQPPKPTKPVPENATTLVAVGHALIAALKRRGRKKATLEGYKTVVEQHMTPHFGDALIGDVNKAAVTGFLTFMEQGGGTGRVRSMKTVVNAYKVLYTLFEYAEAEELVASNPCRKVQPPAVEDTPLGEGNERWMTVEEVEAACREVATDEWGRVEKALYITAAWTGMRMGELLALRWRDVRWDQGSIWVGRSFVRAELSTPKSRKGRHVPLIERVAQELNTLSLVTHYGQPDDLVFGHPHLGTPLDRSKVTRRWQAAVKRAGLRRHRFHDLRHTFATTMLNHLHNDKRAAEQVRQWLGHADLRTTEGTYAQWIHDSAERDAAQRAYERAMGTVTQSMAVAV